MVLARGEVARACSEEGALGSEGRAGGEWWKEFLRMPREGCLDICSLIKGKGGEYTFRPLGW